MPFPIDFSGEIKWDAYVNREGDRSLFMAAMAERLSELESDLVTVEEETISFRGFGLDLNRFGASWNPLIPITSGEIKTSVVNEVLVVSYYLNFRGFAIFCAVSLSIFALFIVISTRDPFQAAPIALAWFWFVGINNWFIAKIGFPRLIRGVLQDINK